MNACDEVNHGGERYVVSNIDQTVIVPDHVGHLLLSSSPAPPTPGYETVQRL